MSILATIEIPQGSYYKYEIDKQSGSLLLDRVLLQSYPYNYGFIENTLSSDGDPLDIFVISDQPIHPLTKVKVKLHKLLKCTDNGVEDNKLLGTIEGDPFSEMGMYVIIKFLETYKTGFTVDSIEDQESAERALIDSELRYKEN